MAIQYKLLPFLNNSYNYDTSLLNSLICAILIIQSYIYVCNCFLSITRACEWDGVTGMCTMSENVADLSSSSCSFTYSVYREYDPGKGGQGFKSPLHPSRDAILRSGPFQIQWEAYFLCQINF